MPPIRPPIIPQSIWGGVVVLIVLAPAMLFIQHQIQYASDREISALQRYQAKVTPIDTKELARQVTSAIYDLEYPKNKTSDSPKIRPDSIAFGSQISRELAECLTEKRIGKGQKQCWRELKRKAWLEGLNELEKLPEPSLAKFRQPNIHWEFCDLITPTHECDLNEFSRVGMEGEGGKWICGPLSTDDENCVLFSLGSNGQFDFENSMKSFTKNKCAIHTFDCTGTWSDASTNFHPWCIAGKDYVDEKGRIFKRISTIFNDLGLAQVNHLKMDIEGYEWEVFRDILKADNKMMLPKQISFELHVEGPDLPWSPKEELGETVNWAYPMINLLREIDAAGYRFAAAEMNPMCPHCAEFVIVREDVM